VSRRANEAVLYLSYDGLLEPLGQSQVVAYLEPLASQHPIHIVSFEKQADRADDDRMAAMRARLSAAGIGWTPLAYHKSPTVPATAYDIAHGALVATGLALRLHASIVHARSYVAALMALAVKRATGAKLLFDMRGFWPDERVDGGLWPKGGALYRGAKTLEGVLIRNADHIVTLTHASAREMQRWAAYDARKPPTTVIPTCADLRLFRPQDPPAATPFVFGYVGSVGTWYLFDETLDLFRVLSRRRPDARMLVVNRRDHEAIHAAAARAGVEGGRLEIVAAEHAEVPRHLSRMHAAASIIKPAYSKIASAPTKLAEYLGCGVPCVGNAGVGDVEEILEGRRVGLALRRFDDAEYEAAADRLFALLADPGVRNRCVGTAAELFSLTAGARDYGAIYAREAL